MYGDTAGSPKDIDHPKEKREGKTEEEMGSHASSLADTRVSFSVNENSTFSKGWSADKDYSKNNLSSVSTSLTSISLPKDDRSKEMQDVLEGRYPAIENGKQKLSYGILRDVGPSMPQNEPVESTGKRIPVGNVLPLKRQTELQTQDASSPKSPQEQEVPTVDYSQVVLRPKISRNANVNYIEETDSLTSSPSEENPPTENIAFMITKTAVQVLSSGEVHDIVSRKGGDIQTVNIDGGKDKTSQQGLPEITENEEPVVCLDKKPVIIIFDEPMDIRSAYKRLSTIFEECDEELEKMMTEEKIEEEEEDEEGENEMSVMQNKELQTVTDGKASAYYSRSQRREQQYKFPLPSDSSFNEVTIPEEKEITKSKFNKFNQMYGLDSEVKLDSPDQFGSRQDAKKKFKFKFPKKQLAALTQAIRTGTKTGKKTLQVVVYEEEEEDGTLKQHKEAKRFEITRSQPEDNDTNASGNQELALETTAQTSRTDEIRKNTYRTLDSLEQTIKQLENTISEMSPKSVPESAHSVEGTTVPCSSHIAQEILPREPVVLDDSHAGVEPPSSIPSASRKVP